ncbi:FYVE multi-domain protein [Pyrenophora tritici-repentis]|nr:FYVE multi-domain protein [Pyrenophora tritici-repentis]KAI1563075.1 FYVE multi-domain protein [Pyrenophora tritici-repentis]KAI1573232.1 FYVE multi-domain protein [Pyrenophora tritici-repentis]KAI1576463.1 FYVE multi-domain protein [Pyrenophora tritici-repentis]PZD34708.1 FYVE multi-domain protein [Pyrenophora tritici-repentis]
MASRRSLGGGRVLGSGRNLSPAAASPQSAAIHRRNASLLSPSESSVSLSSQTSNSPASTSETREDITSRVLIGPNDNAAARASNRLVCPICNEEMVTLLQLNRHLDDNHQNLVVEEQDEVKNWFEAQMHKAKSFQPLAVLNQKLKGLDVFESNDAPKPPQPSHSASSSTAYVTHDPAPVRRDPEEEVTRAHWQRLGYRDSRDGYNDHHGVERDHFDEFANIRRKRVDRERMEVSRLEKRLTKLTQLLANPPPVEETPMAGSWFSLPGHKNHRKALEQSIITWEEDASVSNCPFCQQEFSTYTFRRSHCRMCGRVVCSDPKTECSKEIGLNVAADSQDTEKGAGQLNIDVRMCKDCQHTLFARSDFERELADKPKDQRAYENLAQFERGIRLLLPRFHKLLQALQDPDKSPTPQQLTDATKVRKRLMDGFAQFDVAAKRIRDLPTDSPTQQKLQRAVYQQAYSFLNLHMLPLRSLPKILKHAAPQGRPSGGSALASIKYNNHSTGSVVSSSEVSAMESEEKELRERLIVLEEQKFMVSEMVADATRHRRFDEVSSLAQNLEDLNKEIDQINGQLGQLDFASAYRGGLDSPQPG